MAGSAEAYARVERYWLESAKERLAGLSGPMNILKGQLPPTSAYRSVYLDELRADAAAGRLKSDSPIVSPQIEPTVKRRFERMPDSPEALSLHHAVMEERSRAARRLSLASPPDYERMSEEQRYVLLLDRYRGSLEPAGFALDSHRRQGSIFRKRTSSGEFDFLFVDTSKDRTTLGLLDTAFALVGPRKAVLPSALSLSALATIPSDCLVPEFRVANGFDKDSYAELCLACDANCLLARTLFRRVDDLLSGS